MARARAKNPVRRTFVPDEYLRLLGARIQLALQEEHIRYDASKPRARRSRYSIERVCVATGIPSNTMNSFISGKRLPSVVDIREICRFAGVSFEELMSVIPSRSELDEAYFAKQEELMRARMEPDDDDDEEEHE